MSTKNGICCQRTWQGTCYLLLKHANQKKFYFIPTSLLVYLFSTAGMSNIAQPSSLENLFFDKPSWPSCSSNVRDCCCRRTVLNNNKIWWYKMSHMGRRNSHLVMQIHHCQRGNCRTLWVLKLLFMGRKHQYTHFFAVTVLNLLRFDTIQDVPLFINCLTRKATELKTVALLIRTYSSLLTQHLSPSDIAVGRYHIIIFLKNQTIDSLHREQQNSLGHLEQKSPAGCLFLRLRNYESFNNALQQFKVEFLLQSIKGQLRLLWAQDIHSEALAFLNKWFFDTLMSGVWIPR